MPLIKLAAELQKFADQLKASEEKILNFYVAKTGVNKKNINKWRKEVNLRALNSSHFRN